MQNSVPSISVAMSVYNGERFLAGAIESVLEQTFADFEFLILDDGSRDATRAIVAHYAGHDPRIRLIARENRGLVASLNELLAVSRAPLIARMDADDLCPSALRTRSPFWTTIPKSACWEAGPTILTRTMLLIGSMPRTTRSIMRGFSPRSTPATLYCAIRR